MRDFLEILRCPECHSSLLEYDDKSIICENCKCSYEVREGIPVFLSEKKSHDINLSISKWDENYKANFDRYIEDIDEHIESRDIKDVLKYIDNFWSHRNNCLYLEIGCGPMLLGLHMARRGHRVIGIDSSFEALRLAREIFSKKLQNNNGALFICADVKKMPLAADSIDLIYGGGVIEHFDNLKGSVSELYRVCKSGGAAFNTVPCLSLGALTYRQLWGNIPDLPVIKQMAEFIHIGLLKSRHMKFGYEKSYLVSKLRRVFKKAGFSGVDIGYFDCNLKFEFVRNNGLKEVLKRVARNRLFWPMVYVSSIK